MMSFHEPVPLSKFAYETMIRMARIENKPLDPEKIPLNIARQIWNESNAKEIVAAGSHPATLPWFSTVVTKSPINFTVRIEKSIHSRDQIPREQRFCVFDSTHRAVVHYESKCVFSMTFEDKPEFSWNIKPPRYEGLGGGGYRIYCNDQEYHEYNQKYFPMEYKLMIESIDWVCKIFRTEIHNLEISWSDIKFEMFLEWCDASGFDYWSRIRNARNLTIEKSEDSKFLSMLLPYRHENNLPTTATTITYDDPIFSPLECFYNLNIRYGKLNILKYTFANFMDLIEKLLPTADVLNLRIQAYTTDDIVQFKSRFNLLEPNGFLSDYATVEPMMPDDFDREKSLTGYILKPDGSAMAFFFVRDFRNRLRYGIQTKMVACRFVRKDTLPEDFEQNQNQWIQFDD